LLFIFDKFVVIDFCDCVINFFEVCYRFFVIKFWDLPVILNPPNDGFFDTGFTRQSESRIAELSRYRMMDFEDTRDSPILQITRAIA
jgi:hypothetical protein